MEVNSEEEGLMDNVDEESDAEGKKQTLVEVKASKAPGLLRCYLSACLPVYPLFLNFPGWGDLNIRFGQQNISKLLEEIKELRLKVNEK